MRILRYPWGGYISSVSPLGKIHKLHKLPEDEYISYISSPGEDRAYYCGDILNPQEITTLPERLFFQPIFVHQHRETAQYGYSIVFLPGIFRIRTHHRPSHTLNRLVDLEHRETNHSHSLLGQPMRPAILNCLLRLNVAPTNVRFAHEVIFVSTTFACWEAREQQQRGENNRNDYSSFWAEAGLKTVVM